MTIAVDCRMLGSGGIGTYIASLLPYFLESHDCLLIGDKDKLNAYSSSSHAILIPCDVEPFSLKELAVFPLSILHRINKCTIFYTPYCNIPSGIKIPVFSTIHDVVFLDVPGLTSKTGVQIRKFFYQRAINKSAALFTVSNFSAARIRTKLKCHNISIVVTYNALPAWFSSDSRYEQAEKKEQILFVGNIKKHKGLHVLLTAFKKVLNKGLSARLIIVGNADNFRTGDKSVCAEIDTFPKESICFTGHISDEELRNLYSQSKLLVQPSFYEGFGIPPLEALSLGTHALVSDIPVFREIYGKFPVKFFKSGDSDDLAENIIACMNDTSSVPGMPDCYSYKKSADIILAAFSFYADNKKNHN